MKLIALLLLTISSNCLALTFKQDGKSLHEFGPEDFRKGITVNNSTLNPETILVYNIERKEQKNYEGVSFFELLEAIYGKNWAQAKVIVFVALDGYQVSARIPQLLKDAQNHQGVLAFGEQGKKGFTPFIKGKKTIDPGPFYLVWANFPEGSHASLAPELKWPYQLKSIDLKN